VVAFQLGKASKPSLLGGDEAEKRRNLFQLNDTLARLGYSIHVIDSERVLDDIGLQTYDDLLSYSEENETRLTTVITIPVRRVDFEQRFYESLEIVKNHRLAGICIVAGNPAYLDAEDLAKPSGKLLVNACGEARRKLGHGRLIMVGTEHVVKPAVKAVKLYGAVPLALLNGYELMNEIRIIREAAETEIAIYAPYYIGEEIPEKAWSQLTAYALRRLKNKAANHEDIIEKVNQVALLGSVEETAKRLWTVVKNNSIETLVGYPVEEGHEQLERLRKAVSVMRKT